MSKQVGFGHASNGNGSGPSKPQGPGIGILCLYCGKDEIQYRTRGCNHLVACKKCAMKMATGGKCKECGALFPGFERVMPGSARMPDPDSDDSGKGGGRGGGTGYR